MSARRDRRVCRRRRPDDDLRRLGPLSLPAAIQRLHAIGVLLPSDRAAIDIAGRRAAGVVHQDAYLLAHIRQPPPDTISADSPAVGGCGPTQGDSVA